MILKIICSSMKILQFMKEPKIKNVTFFLTFGYFEYFQGVRFDLRWNMNASSSIAQDFLWILCIVHTLWQPIQLGAGQCALY